MKTLNLTVTGVVGNGKTLTAQLFSNVRSYLVQQNGVLEIIDADGFARLIDISAATTFTTTISGSTYAVTIS